MNVVLMMRLEFGCRSDYQRTSIVLWLHYRELTACNNVSGHWTNNPASLSASKWHTYMCRNPDVSEWLVTWKQVHTHWTVTIIIAVRVQSKLALFCILVSKDTCSNLLREFRSLSIFRLISSGEITHYILHSDSY